MADASDVRDAIAGFCATACYPNGSSQPSITGAAIRVYGGWPLPGLLDTDLSAGVCHVSVFPENISRNVTRFQPEWDIAAPVTPTMTATVSGATITFAGTPAVGQIVGVQVGNPANLIATNAVPPAYTYVVLSTDALDDVATAVAALVSGSAAGAVVTASTTPVAAVVTMTQTASLVMRQQQQRFRVSCWCPSDALRSTIASAIDQSLAAIEMGGMFLTPDNSACRLVYHSTRFDDMSNDALVFRRDLCYMVEYPTLQTQAQAEMAAGVFNSTPSGPSSDGYPPFPVPPS